jgi:large subunit ribosomal protein L3
MTGPSPTLLGLPAIKVGTMHTITVDDREKTPNFGKPLFNPTSVLAVPETAIVGLRLYSLENGASRAVGEVYSKTPPKGLALKSSMDPEQFAAAWKDKLGSITRVSALVAITPREAGLPQKAPIVFEVGVGGGDVQAQVDYVTKLIGKAVKFSDVFKAGSYVDVIGITKGHGFEGPVTRMGIKRKQHKSRKSVRAVGL